MAKGDWQHKASTWNDSHTGGGIFSVWLDNHCEGGWELHKMSTHAVHDEYAGSTVYRLCVFRRRKE
jgi:hypothetical protein